MNPLLKPRVVEHYVADSGAALVLHDPAGLPGDGEPDFGVAERDGDDTAVILSGRVVQPCRLAQAGLDRHAGRRRRDAPARPHARGRGRDRDLYEHPAVREAAVIGIPHPELGEEVGAAVALKRGADVDEPEVREFVRAQVAA
jgi:hypothetical protein